MSKTVNFIEAVNSGRRFRAVDSETVTPKHRDKYVYISELGSFLYHNVYSAKVVKFLNSQFILEEKSITISESEFDKAFNKTSEQDSIETARMKLKKELGF